jgi:hypothetical protein
MMIVPFERSVMSTFVTCAACTEENKLGSERCARCGAVLAKVAGTKVDPELAAFNAAQAEMAEKNRQDRLDRVLKDIGTTGWGVLGPR